MTLRVKMPGLSNIFPPLIYIEIKGTATTNSSFIYDGLFLSRLGAIKHALQQQLSHLILAFLNTGKNASLTINRTVLFSSRPPKFGIASKPKI